MAIIFRRREWPRLGPMDEVCGRPSSLGRFGAMGDRGDGIDAATLDGWIARLRLIPDERRDFAVPAMQAEREFGFDARLTDELVGRGLPHAGGPDGLLLATTDLHYLGLRLGCATIYQGVLRRWAATLTELGARASTPVEIRCTAYAPPGTDVEVLVAPGQRMTVRAGDRPAALRFEAELSGDWPELPTALHPLLTDLAELDFCWIPESMQTDLGFVARTRLSNCAAAAYTLVAQAPELGVEARMAYGLLLAPPYSTPHYWAEVRTGEDEWTPADPLLVGLLARFAGLDAASWPPTRSPGAILLALAEPETPLVLDRASGAPVQATFLTKVRSPQ
jgi:hypothetical protein